MFSQKGREGEPERIHPAIGILDSVVSFDCVRKSFRCVAWCDVYVGYMLDSEQVYIVFCDIFVRVFTV